jgi:hypothetical protein
LGAAVERIDAFDSTAVLRSRLEINFTNRVSML